MFQQGRAGCRASENVRSQNSVKVPVFENGLILARACAECSESGVIFSEKALDSEVG